MGGGWVHYRYWDSAAEKGLWPSSIIASTRIGSPSQEQSGILPETGGKAASPSPRPPNGKGVSRRALHPKGRPAPTSSRKPRPQRSAGRTPVRPLVREYVEALQTQRHFASRQQQVHSKAEAIDTIALGFLRRGYARAAAKFRARRVVSVTATSTRRRTVSQSNAARGVSIPSAGSSQRSRVKALPVGQACRCPAGGVW